MDASGTATLLSPHDAKTKEWIYFSKNTKTGEVLRVPMEKLIAIVERLSGEAIAERWIETLIGEPRRLTEEEQALHLDAVDKVIANKLAEERQIDEARRTERKTQES